MFLSATLSTSGMWGTREKGRAEQVRKKLMGQAILGLYLKSRRKSSKHFVLCFFFNLIRFAMHRSTTFLQAGWEDCRGEKGTTLELWFLS